MRFEATEFVKRVLLEGFPADAPESGNPIDNGRLRFDSLRVEAVEQDNRTHKWTRDELREIRDTYRKKLRELLKARRS